MTTKPRSLWNLEMRDDGRITEYRIFGSYQPPLDLFIDCLRRRAAGLEDPCVSIADEDGNGESVCIVGHREPTETERAEWAKYQVAVEAEEREALAVLAAKYAPSSPS